VGCNGSNSSSSNAAMVLEVLCTMGVQYSAMHQGRTELWSTNGSIVGYARPFAAMQSVAARVHVQGCHHVKAPMPGDHHPCQRHRRGPASADLQRIRSFAGHQQPLAAEQRVLCDIHIISSCISYLMTSSGASRATCVGCGPYTMADACRQQRRQCCIPTDQHLHACAEAPQHLCWPSTRSQPCHNESITVWCRPTLTGSCTTVVWQPLQGPVLHQ
jgi:hypothetical protein